jgi:Eukaryotic protein of unknown function (DUF846)
MLLFTMRYSLLQVGLRWWSHVKEDGTNSWVFESSESEANSADSKLFWIGLYAPVAMWVALFIIGIIKFNIQWLIIVAVAITLSTANIVGYHKCSKDSKNKVHTSNSNTNALSDQQCCSHQVFPHCVSVGDMLQELGCSSPRVYIIAVQRTMPMLYVVAAVLTPLLDAATSLTAITSTAQTRAAIESTTMHRTSIQCIFAMSKQL